MTKGPRPPQFKFNNSFNEHFPSSLFFSKVFCRQAIDKHRAYPNPHLMGDFGRSFSAFFASCSQG